MKIMAPHPGALPPPLSDIMNPYGSGHKYTQLRKVTGRQRAILLTLVHPQ